MQKPEFMLAGTNVMRTLFVVVVLLLGFTAPRTCFGQEKAAADLELRDVAYVENGHERQKLDLFLPKRGEEPRPLIVWIHGGGWSQGSKVNPPKRFLEQGYALASVNYRLSQHATFPAQIEDCKAAVRFLKAHSKKWGIDPERVGVIGPSAGGHLVALLGVSAGVPELEGAELGHPEQSSRVHCVVDLFGPTDFLQMGGSHDQPRSPESRLIGGPIQENRDKAARANPIRYVSRDAPPFLILHGENDPLVPYSQSELLYAALKKAGSDVELVKVEKAGHGGPEFQSQEITKRIDAFFGKHLKPAAKPSQK